MPHSNISVQTRHRAKKLRRDMTRAEIAMWSMLRDLRPFGARFRRETPIGPYFADFAWLSAGFVVEVDGDSHETDHGRRHDKTRDTFLKNEGFTVLRFDNDQVLDGGDFVFLEIVRSCEGFFKTPIDQSFDEKAEPFVPAERPRDR